jgi:hypothetical protein
MLEIMALTLFLTRLACHVVIIALIWRYSDDTARYRPGVGMFAASVAACNGWAIFIGLRQFYLNGLIAELDPAYTGLMFILLLAVFQLKGNVAMLVTPLINFARCFKRKHVHGR